MLFKLEKRCPHMLAHAPAYAPAHALCLLFQAGRTCTMVHRRVPTVLPTDAPQVLFGLSGRPNPVVNTIKNHASGHWRPPGPFANTRIPQYAKLLPAHAGALLPRDLKRMLPVMSLHQQSHSLAHLAHAPADGKHMRTRSATIGRNSRTYALQ